MPMPGQKRPEDRNAPPLPPTNQRDETAIAPTEKRGQSEENTALAKKVHGLAPGRMVRAVIRAPYNPGEPPVIRPAIVVDVAQVETGVCNLQIFTDGNNDRRLFAGLPHNVVWGVSYQYSETREPGSWHWPDRI
jgi:hypothetical protein